jgi:hypothetical protein
MQVDTRESKMIGWFRLKPRRAREDKQVWRSWEPGTTDLELPNVCSYPSQARV